MQVLYKTVSGYSSSYHVEWQLLKLVPLVFEGKVYVVLTTKAEKKKRDGKPVEGDLRARRG